MIQDTDHDNIGKWKIINDFFDGDIDQFKVFMLYNLLHCIMCTILTVLNYILMKRSVIWSMYFDPIINIIIQTAIIPPYAPYDC